MSEGIYTLHKTYSVSSNQNHHYIFHAEGSNQGRIFKFWSKIQCSIFAICFFPIFNTKYHLKYICVYIYFYKSRKQKPILNRGNSMEEIGSAGVKCMCRNRILQKQPQCLRLGYQKGKAGDSQNLGATRSSPQIWCFKEGTWAGCCWYLWGNTMKMVLEGPKAAGGWSYFHSWGH